MCSVDALDEIASDLRETLPLTALSPGEPQLFPDKVTIATVFISLIVHVDSLYQYLADIKECSQCR